MMMLLLTLLQDTTDFSTSSDGRGYNPPDGPLFYLIVLVSSIIVLATIIYTVKWFIWPGEKSDNHIKRKILESKHKKDSQKDE